PPDTGVSVALHFPFAMRRIRCDANSVSVQPRDLRVVGRHAAITGPVNLQNTPLPILLHCC
ncbi:MAG: hypothetical protein ACOVRM_05550, partial [Planctomycetaceae bacterium]